jgi:hypothetical protein
MYEKDEIQQLLRNLGVSLNFEIKFTPQDEKMLLVFSNGGEARSQELKVKAIFQTLAKIAKNPSLAVIERSIDKPFIFALPKLNAEEINFLKKIKHSDLQIDQPYATGQTFFTSSIQNQGKYNFASQILDIRAHEHNSGYYKDIAFNITLATRKNGENVVLYITMVANPAKNPDEYQDWEGEVHGRGQKPSSAKGRKQHYIYDILGPAYERMKQWCKNNILNYKLITEKENANYKPKKNPDLNDPVNSYLQIQPHGKLHIFEQREPGLNSEKMKICITGVDDIHTTLIYLHNVAILNSQQVCSLAKHLPCNETQKASYSSDERANLIHEIATTISVLQQEIRSCFAMNKDRKVMKIAALTELSNELLSSRSGSIQTIIGEIREKYPQIDEGKIWHRTKDMLDRYMHGTENNPTLTENSSLMSST